MPDFYQLLLLPPGRDALRRERLHFTPLCADCHADVELPTGWRLGASRRPCAKCGNPTAFLVYPVRS